MGKLNSITSEEMASILCQVITSAVIGCDESRFTSLSEDGSEQEKLCRQKS